jgi:hypothetical protein
LGCAIEEVLATNIADGVIWKVDRNYFQNDYRQTNITDRRHHFGMNNAHRVSGNWNGGRLACWVIQNRLTGGTLYGAALIPFRKANR